MGDLDVHDADLTPLFERCSNEELHPVVGYILKASTNMLEVNDAYKTRPGDHRAYVPAIVREVRDFGGNSLLNLVRPGVPYAEIARDVASKVGAKIEKNDSVEQVEFKILTRIFEQSLKKMSPKERSDVEEDFRRAGVSNVNLSTAGAPVAMLLAQASVQMSGFVAYRIAVVVANAVAKAVLGSGLSLATNAALTKALSLFAGPIGWVISAIWTVVDLAGPAYRVTIPVVCHTAYLRQKRLWEPLGQ